MNRKIPVLLTITIIMILLSACGSTDLSSILLDQEISLIAPIPKSDEYIDPPVSLSNKAANVHIQLEDGTNILMKLPAVAQRMYEASQSPMQEEKNVSCPMDIHGYVSDSSGNKRFDFQVAADGCPNIYIEDLNKNIRLPHYVYYSMEYEMLKEGYSFLPDFKWEPADGTGAMELRLNHILTTSAIARYGYTDASFTTYELLDYIYDASSVIVYLITSRAGYTSIEGNFIRQYFKTTAVKLIFTRIDGRWRLTFYDEALDTTKSTSIRTVTPYEFMDKAKSLIEDPTVLEEELHHQTVNYLRNLGLASMPITD